MSYRSLLAVDSHGDVGRGGSTGVTTGGASSSGEGSNSWPPAGNAEGDRFWLARDFNAELRWYEGVLGPQWIIQGRTAYLF